jgi:acyl carrier protein
MAFSKTWKQDGKWELKSLTFDELFKVIVEVVTKQLDEVKKSEVSLDANLVIDYEADSVDIVAMLLYLEDMFKNASETTRTVVPTDKLGQIVLVEDIFDIIYEVLITIESKMETFSEIKPDFDALEKRQKMGELYPKE